MRVLGISPLDKDATASFLKDGRVVFACAEERLSRVKLQDGFPHRAIELGLERTGWDPNSIDVVAYAFFDGTKKLASFVKPSGTMLRCIRTRQPLVPCWNQSSYPAKDPAVNQWLNHQLGRTEFMPFAPAALASQAPCLFKNLTGCERTAEFMTVTFDCTDQMQKQCPAAVHVDGTARPQLVSERTNPSFHRILQRYFELTGIPAMINTSFNMHEEPIICTPEDAVRAFLAGRLDYLAIGEFLVQHPRFESINRERQRRPT